MTRALTHKRIAVAGGRKFEELAAIIAKQGGEALLRPMMGSVSNDSDDLAEIIRKVCAGADWFVLVTGVGTKALLEKAEELALGDRLRELLGSAHLAARGYKTFNALKALGFKPVIIDDDGTVEGLRRQLESFDFTGKQVAVQLHGERMPALTDWLRSQGALVTEIPLYFYQEPLEQDVQQLLYEVIAGDVDAVAFTSNTQVKFFFEGAKKHRAEGFLQKALNERVMALSVGSVTSAELRKNGIRRIIAPAHERMGAMVMALAAYYQGAAGEKGLSLAAPGSPARSSLPVILTKMSQVLVIGGGKVAERKVRFLLEAGIHPTVISPELRPGLLELKSQEKIVHREKQYEVEALTDAQMVIAATNDVSVNEQIAHDALAHKLLCNVVDKPELGNVHTVGTIRRGDLMVTVSSKGKAPALTRYVKETLEQQFSERYADMVDILHHHREAMQTLSIEQRHQIIETLVADTTASFEEVFSKVKAMSTLNQGST
jgi:uroporphyrinogen-III synthase